MSEQRQQSADRTDDTRQGARDEHANEAPAQFVERFAAQLVDAGMQRMPARVFACLLASESGVLTSAELSERLQISPAAVSGAVRYLSQVDMVSREREPGSRRDRYRVHNDQWYEALTRRNDLLTRWENTLREGVSSLGEATPAGRRLGETLAFFEFMQNELAGMLQRWRDHRDELRLAHDDRAVPPGASAKGAFGSFE